MYNRRMLAFCGNAHPALAKAICDYLDMPLGNAVVKKFPDGEIDVKINDDVRGADTFVVQPTCHPVNESLFELLLLTDCLRRASADRVTAVLPYYGYARKDRKDEGRVPITAKLVANLITTAGANRVLAMDLHASQIQGFFDIPVDHMSAASVLARSFLEPRIADLVVVSPDVGSVKLALPFAKRLGAALAVVDKQRVRPDLTEPGFVIGDVKGKNVLMIDDIIATGGSVCAAARLLKERGAKSVQVTATHAVLCPPAVERLGAAPIDRIVVTDTIPLQDSARGLPIAVVSVAGLLGEAMKRIHSNESVSSLFT
ncbi:MAG TPA: ribose-phosphate pyrophosphokinase [Planctomycetota bacterium]|nr:ribose-phosphate pyrophosphokinase [Planctomycetota bacterium]